MGPSIDQSRSRSPYRSTESPRKRKRSRSPRRHRSEHRSKALSAPIPLPLKARPLTRHDLTTYRPMFALYMDIQKQKDIEELPEDEVKGRWKSFMGKWNRGELAEGWFDPQTLQKAQDAVDGEDAVPRRKSSPDYTRKSPRSGGRLADGSDEDSDFGPYLPTNTTHTDSNGQRFGPTIPRLDDLQIQKELLDEGLSKERRQELEDLRAARKADRKTQLARLDELAPKADPGTRERHLEKKKEKAASKKAFAEGPDVELPDAEVMGGGDSLEELKRMKQANERKMTERELRREEVLRAKQAEREERVRGMRAKEEKTMAMLQEIAKARFGSGNDQHATLRCDKLAYIKLAHIKLAHIKLAHIKLAHIKLAHIKLAHIKLAHIKLAHIKLAHIKLAHIKLAHIKLAHIKLAHIKLANINLDDGLIFGTEKFAQISSLGPPCNVLE